MAEPTPSRFPWRRLFDVGCVVLALTFCTVAALPNFLAERRRNGKAREDVRAFAMAEQRYYDAHQAYLPVSRPLDGGTTAAQLQALGFTPQLDWGMEWSAVLGNPENPSVTVVSQGRLGEDGPPTRLSITVTPNGLGSLDDTFVK